MQAITTPLTNKAASYPWTFRQAFDVVQQLFRLSELSEDQFKRGRVCLTSSNWQFIAIPGAWALTRNNVTLYAGRARITNRRVSIGA